MLISENRWQVLKEVQIYDARSSNNMKVIHKERKMLKWRFN